MKNNRLYIFFSQQKLNIALISLLGMAFGFLCGRAILSISMLLFMLNGIWNVAPKDWLKPRWTLLALLWVGMYALSYFWSEDIPYWQERVQVKFPFLMLPLAFGLLPQFTEKMLKTFTIGLIAIVAGGCIYSLSFYFSDAEKVLNGYYFAHVLLTPSKDHIRFSIFVAWSVIWCSYRFKKTEPKAFRILLLASIGFFCIYLHILAVRSGLLFLYSFVFVYVFYLFFKGKRKLSLLIVSCFSIGIVAAYQLIPSFNAKIGYVKYSIQEYRQGNISANYSDIGRLISYDLALKTIKENPLFGVGAGDIREEMKHKYEQFSPNTLPEQRIVPHNQLIEVCLGVGIAGLVLFMFWLLYPIRKLKRTRDGFYVFATWFALLLSLMVEPMLEVQYGVFVFLFCLLMMQKSATPRESDLAIQS